MTDKTTDSKQWTDPSDFGLPFVEVVPLNQTTFSKKEEEKPIPVDVAEIKKKTLQSVKPVFTEAEKTVKAEAKIEQKKTSNTWIWVAAILALTVVWVIIWQMNQTVVSDSESANLVSRAVEEVPGQENDAVTINSTLAEETQTTEIQSTIPDSISSVTPTPVPAQTGTTIASKVSGTLVRVTEKADRAQFYIVVGSLPNEALALEESAQYMNRAETVYLILPYEDVTNYRLAIATSRGWTAINEELARVKDQYTEDLWILKY
jgi:hypothetical protein